MDDILSFWKAASVRRKKIYSMLFILVLSIVVTYAGSLVPLNEVDAEFLASQTDQIVADNPDIASLSLAIFVNNFRLCLLMFIPVFGAVFGMFVLFSTGISLGAISMVQGFSSSFVLLALMITPIFWLEFVSYTLGMSESIWLFRRLYQKRWSYIKWTAIFLGTATLLLVIGAVVEAWLILLAV